MFMNALAGAIDAAHPKMFDYLSRQLWQAHAAGHIGDAEAQELAERMHQRCNQSAAASRALFPGGSDTDTALPSKRTSGLPTGTRYGHPRENHCE
jgi:hypothetical protein